MNKNRFSAFLLLLVCVAFSVKAESRWSIQPSGAIKWQINKANVPHNDHIEMSGLKVSTVLRYGVDADGAFVLNRSIVWPMLRTIPNDTHASLTRRFAWKITDMLLLNGRSPEKEKVKEISLDGTMRVESELVINSKNNVLLTRVLFPSTTEPAFCEKYTLKNIGKDPVKVETPSAQSVVKTDASKGVDGSYQLVWAISGPSATELQPGDEMQFSAVFAAFKQNEKIQLPVVDKEWTLRRELINKWWSNLVLDTPDSVINTMFAFAKIRAAESIYDTKGGLMHGPGGESYYAAIWANDQAEYINPFFPYLGYDIGNRSALCSYEHFARFMNPSYTSLPSSIIAEGLDVWAGAGDRGDAAMIAYGASRYALSRGDKMEAEKLWPLIEWTLEYCKRKLNTDGVVQSDSDELEGRFPAGKANLCTSSLYYDALRSAAYLAKDFLKPASIAAAYTKEANVLKKNMDRYFGATVEGFATYQYYKGNDVLRSWICIPLTVGIYDRKEATIEALFSPRLCTENGLLTQAGSETFWDRSTLYALRGIYASGETEKATNYLRFYSEKRLLGDHVPYAIEAWPEGEQRHLSAESGLYARIITEGMFGIRPTGLHSFLITPRLPKEWNYMRLKNIRAHNGNFDVEVTRLGNKLSVQIQSEGKIISKKQIKDGASLSVALGY